MTLLSQFVVLATGSDLTVELRQLRLKIFVLVTIILSLLLVSSGYNIYYETRQKVIQERNQSRVLILEERNANPNPIMNSSRPLPPRLEDTEEALSRIRSVIFVNNSLILSFLMLLTWISLYYLLYPVASSQIKRDKFLAKASHELRTPLAILYSEMSLAAMENNPNDLKTVLIESLSEISRLQKLSDRLLNKLDHRLNKTTVPLKLFIQEIVDRLSSLNSKNIKINIEVPDDVKIVTSKEIFHQLIFNLIDNIVRYAKPKSQATITWDGADGSLKLNNQAQNNNFRVGTGLGICIDLSKNLGISFEYSMENGMFKCHLKNLETA